MEEQVDKLVNKIWVKHKSTPRSQRILIGVAGIPGSGKTTLAAKVTSRLNALHRESSPGTSAGGTNVAAFVPMDGYHLTRAQLSAMPDPENAHARRGAAFTFDGAAYARLVRQLRAPLVPESTTVYAPSFDHARKDPIADDIAVAPSIRIVVFEGNYVALDREPWSGAAAAMDEVWFVEVGFQKARERLVRRHVEAGIARDEDEANRRVTENDLVNAKEIDEQRVKVHEVVISKEDEDWVPEKQGVGDGEVAVH